MFEPVEDRAKYDFTDLDHKLDQVKATVFRRNDAAFFGPLMCSMNFVWSELVDTAACDGVSLYWNPQFFMEAPIKYEEERFNEFVLMHELWHPARLHMLRCGGRDPDYWNFACDVRINNDLKNAGYSFGTFPAWYRPEMDKPDIAVEEDIYDIINQQKMKIPPNPWGNGDMLPMNDQIKNRAIDNVVKAVQSAKISGNPGSVPGMTNEMLDKFLTPIIPWEQHLHKWMRDLLDEEYTWSRPNRRYLGI